MRLNKFPLQGALVVAAVKVCRAVDLDLFKVAQVGEV